MVAHAASGTADFGRALPAGIDQVARLGWLGADFFFVLSGFIIHFTAAPKGVGGGAVAHYARSRITRIYVPYLPIALALVPLIHAEGAGRLRVPRWSVFLGAASYSLYLVHNPVLSVAVRLCRSIDLRDPFLVTAAGLAASLAGGIGYYLVVERPLSRRVNDLIRRRPPPHDT